VLGPGPAERAEISTSVLIVVQTATVIVAVVHHWAPVEVVAVAALAMAVHLLVEAALHGQESCPPMCSEALRCFRSRSIRSTHPQVEHRPCSRSSRPFVSAVVYI
jgi:hypothetical protein